MQVRRCERIGKGVRTSNVYYTLLVNNVRRHQFLTDPVNNLEVIQFLVM
jgi:hypothetical protein